MSSLSVSVPQRHGSQTLHASVGFAQSKPTHRVGPAIKISGFISRTSRGSFQKPPCFYWICWAQTASFSRVGLNLYKGNGRR